MTALSIASVWVVQQSAEIVRSVLVIATFVSAVVIAAVVFRSSARPERVLHPLVGPLLYLTYAFIVPQIYMTVTGQGIGSIPHSTLTLGTASVMSLTVFGYIAGTRIAASLSRNSYELRAKRLSRTLIPGVDRFGGAASITTYGRLILIVALAAKIYQVATTGVVFSSVYGADQLNYDSGTAIATLGESLIAVGCLAVMYGNSSQYGRPIALADGVLIGSILFVSLALLGSRGEVVAPIVLYLWFWLRAGRRVSKTWAVLGGASLILIFVAVWQLRSSSTGGVRYSMLQQILWQTSSPQSLTANVLAIVPSVHPFYEGATYLSALKFALPGFISRSIFGDVEGTGALVYREIIGATDVNQGYGFSMPTEAYLNFGVLGVLTVSVLLGLFMQFGFERATDPQFQSALTAFLYPLIVSYLPYGIRSDFLGQFKSIFYPLVIIGLALIAVRSFSGARSAPTKALPTDPQRR